MFWYDYHPSMVLFHLHFTIERLVTVEVKMGWRGWIGAAEDHLATVAGRFGAFVEQHVRPTAAARSGLRPIATPVQPWSSAGGAPDHQPRPAYGCRKASAS
jgi:hypothetical protein